MTYLTMFRIRENFTAGYHQLSTITDYESKWRSLLLKAFKDTGNFTLKCEKISDQVNCIDIKRNGDDLNINTSYLIGLDYLNGELPFMVEPKFSYQDNDFDIDFYSILFKSLPYVKSGEDISNLYFVDFSKPAIEIDQKDDFLTPILVIQFISYLEKICHFGLQKGYYWVEENLQGKVKGKILINDTIKKNHLKSKFATTYCRFQDFGINTVENKFLKFAFRFCLNYLDQFKKLKITDNITASVGLIKGTLEKVSYDTSIRKEITVRKNPLFPIYENALKLANLILKRLSFNIVTSTSLKVKTYPYWINMSKLFEIHVLKLLRKSYKDGVFYQKKYSGLFPDIILNLPNYKAVIDVKYKAYDEKGIDLDDVRQVAAYSKMKSIYKHTGLERNNNLDALVIYPKVKSQHTELNDLTLSHKTELRDYYNIYKLDVDIPTI